MIRNNYSKSQIFLLEFIIVVLFFAICSTICVSVFVKADRISKDSSRDVNAMVIAKNAAECFKASDTGNPGEYLNIKQATDGSYMIYYDEEFDETSMPGAAYTLKIDLGEKEKGILTAIISVYEKQEDTAFYIMSVDKYVGESI